MALLSSPLPVAAGNLRPIRRRSPARIGQSSLTVFSQGRRNPRLSSFPRLRAAKREERGGEVSDKQSKKQAAPKAKGLGKLVTELGDSAKKVADIVDLAEKAAEEASGAAGKLAGKAVSEASEIGDKLIGKTGAAISEASEVVGNLEVKAGDVVLEGSDIVYKFTEKSEAAVSEASEKIVDELEEIAVDVVLEAAEIVEELFGKRGASVGKSSGGGFSEDSEIVEKGENVGSAVSAAEIVEKVEEEMEAADAEDLKTFDELLAKTRARISEAYEIVDKFNRKPGALAPEILGNLGPRVEISDGYEIVDEIPEKAGVKIPEVSESLDEMLEKAKMAISEASQLVDKVAEKSGAVVSEPSEIVDTAEEEALETVDKVEELSEAVVSEPSEIVDTVEEKALEIIDEVEEKAGAEVSELRENVAPTKSGLSGIPDEWGERGEPEAETIINPDPPKDDDEWGMDQGYDGSDSPLRDDALEDLKLCLVDTFYGTDIGLTASSEVRGEIFELVNQLEALNPTPSPMEVPELIDGNWILLYTAFSELLPLLAIGSVPLLKVKRITQEVDSQSLTIKNSTTISSPFATFSFSASASFEVQTPSRIQVRFREGSFEPPEISQTVDLPESTEVFGQRVDLNPLRQALGPLQGAAAGIARAISGQPPLKVPIPGERSRSWLVTTFLDKDLRISRGDGGLFILAREGSPLLDI